MKNTDLELSIMSCLLLKPELMNQVIVKDEHFKRHVKLWKFMNAFYSKFKTYDTALMYSVCKNKWKIINYIEELLNYEPTPSNFMKYQEALIEECKQSENERRTADKVYNLANELFVGKINLEEFKETFEKIYERKEEL